MEVEEGLQRGGSIAEPDPQELPLDQAVQLSQKPKRGGRRRKASRKKADSLEEPPAKAVRTEVNGHGGGDDFFEAAVDYFLAADQMEADAEKKIPREKVPRKRASGKRGGRAGLASNSTPRAKKTERQKPKKRGRAKDPTSDPNPTTPVRKQKTGKHARLRTSSAEVVKTVEDENGGKHGFGDHVGRMKVFDKMGKQITKSCHQCQEQHIAWRCSHTFGCSVSYCLRCINYWYPGWTVNDFQERCARCRGICNCRACLRKTSRPANPDFCDAQCMEYARHMLRVSGPHVKAFLEAEEAEAACDGKTLDDVVRGIKVPVMDSSGSMRVSCDSCATSIPNLYRNCPSCDIDMCIQCCQYARKKSNTSHTPCPDCGHTMRMQMLMSINVMEILRNVAKEYGDGATPSYWEWLGDHKNGDPAGISDENTSRTYNGNWLLASQRPDGKQNNIFCPSAEDFDLDSPNRADAVRQFQKCMRAGEPVLIRGLRPKINWGPETMYRACVDRGNKQLGAEPKPWTVTVIDCMNKWQREEMHQRTFFNHYESSSSKRVLKVMDWPPAEAFADRLKRHNQDFLEMLPLPEYMHPSLGPLNTYRSLPSRWLPPDIGPKTYVAMGRIPEHKGEGDSVTKLHMDMSDALNVLCHAQYTSVESKNIRVRQGQELWDKPSYGNAGAVWDIVRRVDVPKVRKFLYDRRDGFVHNGAPVSSQRMVDPYHDQMFMLTEEDRKELQEEYGIHVWHFEQHEWEAVYIPSGCPHQVRNLRSCLKTALDFVPPESFRMIKNLKGVNHLIGRQERFRHKDPLSRNGADKLQGTAMLLHAAKEAYCKITKFAQPHGGSYMATVSSRNTVPPAGRRGRLSRAPSRGR